MLGGVQGVHVKYFWKFILVQKSVAKTHKHFCQKDLNEDSVSNAYQEKKNLL